MKRNRDQNDHINRQPDQTLQHATTPIIPPLVITEIPDKAFEYSTILPPTFVIPNTIVRIGKSAFSHSSTLVNVFIPNSVTEIGAGAFCSCHNLTAINLPDSLQKIGRCAFGCTALKSVHFPISLNMVHDYSFCHNFKLTKVNLPITIRRIGEGAFSDCVSLESIQFPKLLDIIGESSFCNNGFRTLEIPLSVIDIGEEAFQDCKQLVSVLIPEQLGFQLFDEESDDWDDNHDLDVYKSSSTVTSEYTKQIMKERNNAGQDEEITINTNAFANCSRLVSIFLADDNIVCAPGAFECCESLDERDIEGKNFHYNTETWLRQRFDDLPVHRMCYFHSKYMMRNDSLKKIIEENKETLLETDAMGMTALHILCCNPTVTLDAIKLVKSANPAAVRARNVQGKSPYMLLLICQNLLPTNIVPYPSNMRFEQPCSCAVTIEVEGEGVIEIVPTMHEFLKSGIQLRQLEILFEFDEDEDVNESLGVSLETRDEESGLFPFMKAATLPHCGLDVVHFLAMRSLNILT